MTRRAGNQRLHVDTRLVALSPSGISPSMTTPAQFGTQMGRTTPDDSRWVSVLGVPQPTFSPAPRPAVHSRHGRHGPRARLDVPRRHRRGAAPTEGLGRLPADRPDRGRGMAMANRAVGAEASASPLLLPIVSSLALATCVEVPTSSRLCPSAQTRCPCLTGSSGRCGPRRSTSGLEFRSRTKSPP